MKTGARWLVALIAVGVVGVSIYRASGGSASPTVVDAGAGPAASAGAARVPGTRRPAATAATASAHQTTGESVQAGGAQSDGPRPAPGPAADLDAALQPVGYAGRERWRRAPVPCWGIRGTSPEDFEVTIDREAHTSGKSSVAMASVRMTDGWGTLYQFASAETLRGQRIEFSADMRTAAVGTGASLFVRIDDAAGKAVAIDNMYYSYGETRDDSAVVDRSLKGDNDWTSVSVVLDVPQDAHALSYGAALTGTGKVWLDNAHLEVVPKQIPTTALVREKDMLDPMAAFRMSEVPPAPNNLDFEPGAGCGE